MTAADCELTAAEILDREFFGIRAKLLEVAASLDRWQRAAGAAAGDVRMDQVRQAIGILHQASLPADGSLAEAVQLNFSLPYNPSWQADFGLS